jgi:hypothetical protein
MTSPATQNGKQPELAALAREFPGWQIWRGASRLYYARHHRDPTLKAQGQDPTDLRDQIRTAIHIRGAGSQPPVSLARAAAPRADGHDH